MIYVFINNLKSFIHDFLFIGTGMDKVMVYFVMAVAILGLLAVFTNTGKPQIKSELLIDPDISNRKIEETIINNSLKSEESII